MIMSEYTVPSLPDAVIDLTMISTALVTNISHFTILCMNGERGPDQVELDIEKDNKILVFPKKPSFSVQKLRTKEVEARGFRDLDYMGIFYCSSTQEVPPVEKVTMINNHVRGVLVFYTASFISLPVGIERFYMCFLQRILFQIISR